MPEGNNGANPNVVVLNPADGGPAPIAPPVVEVPAVESPQVAPAPPAADVKIEDKLQDAAATQAAYYQKIEFVNDSFPRLKFIRLVTAQPPPPAVFAFRRQIEDVCRLVRILFPSDKVRIPLFFTRLQAAADAGLSDPNASIEVGLDNLQDIKDSIADAYTDIRAKLWWWNIGLLAAGVAFCGLGVAALKGLGGVWLWDVNSKDWLAWVVAGSLIPLGAMAGLFIEFIFRVNDDIPYEQLRAINPGRWKPFQRALNTIIVAIVFAAILAAQIIQVGVSGVLLNELSSGKPWLAVIVGFVTGFAFPYVRDLVQQVRPVAREAR